ncbi:putative transcription factor WD40-like family [Rosa chinensis]|uniref:Putative transcription factor WD40-like family n=1 Tax=Rosa chinensis TaxID=74649 RepID=A0A2P6SIM5_ROSCH|nr:putative transcription factor WD40-like family [Rosa chinensis]
MDPTPHLPLQILRSDPTPSAPNRSDPPGSAIDWLPDFLDLSWVSYGASSLLVISHFPSPLSENETVIGPIFRQVFELSGDPSSAVRAVAWSPAVPSLGEVAAAAENCVWVFSHDSASSKGSFCWSQNAVLVNSAKVEAIGWTGSGDGIIASGVEVVLWRRSGRSWEIAWKFKADQPQSLVSATWSVEGPFATAAYQSKWLIEGLLTKEASKCVLVSQRDGKSEFVKSELRHPLPVSMIQWRPLTGKPLSRDAKHPSRHVLLTSCLDGTVRLWCEVDDGRARKVAKDINDHKTMRWSFSVAAVIEINQALNGILGIDIYVTWAIETGGLNKASAGAKKLFSANGYEHDQLGNCEWLIGFGPGMLVKFWAVHCLDDVSPVRFPRVTLWKTQELQVLEGGHVHRTGLSNYNDRIPLNKVVILRNCMSGPPVVCSLIQLLPCNSLVWSLLYTQSSNNVEDLTLNKPGMENTLSCSADGILNLDGHAGRILQVAVHPYSCEVELAVSLDSDGLLLFWFFSTISNYILGRPTLVPTWDICGKLATQSSSSRYTSVRWAPAILNEVAVLLMGHAGGIDCFVVKIHQDEEEIIECHYLCTIPFTGHGPYEDGPNSISTIPLPPTCHETLRCSKFMLLGVWMNGFQALSWEITLHTFDLSRSYCDCDFETGNGPESMWGFEGTFTNVRYCLKVNACSSQIPDPYIHDEVTSFAVVCQGSLMRIEKNLGPTIDQCSSCPAYLMATGCSDGSLKLWRSRIAKLSTPNIPWELVGMFVAHKGPISTVCLSECGRKIATICKDFSSNTVGTLQIWDPIHLAGAGSFVLEDTISFDQELVALNWLPLGNGQLLLGVCMLNQFRVYSLERCGGQTLLNPEKSVKKNIWVCIASTHTFPPICDFFWGPRATAVFVHKSYFCVNSQWLFLVDKKHLANGQSNDMAKNCMGSAGGMKEDTSSIFFDCELQQFDKTLLDESRRDCKSGTPFKTDLKKDYLLSSLFVARSQLDCAWGTKLGLWTMLEVVENLSGSLPVYHPEALFMNIYSGNWKRAYIALRHLNDFLSSESSSGSKHYPSKSSIFVPQILLSTFLDGIISIDSNDKGFQWSGDAVTSSSQLQRDSGQFTYDSYASNNLFSSSSTKYGLVDFVEHLEKYELAAITNIERMQILAIFDLLNEMTNSNSGSAYESLDEPGQRFWIALRFQQLHFVRKFGRSVSVEELVVDSKLIGWAYHSDCQENLFGSFLPNEPSWQEMRNLGVGFWFTNTAQLRSRMEKLARLQYLKRRDPKDCALLYIALNRIQVLTGLFKISKDEKDKPLVTFLSRNFQEEKNKAAALKNAYVLMGRHQLELAVAFFLLGGDTSSAVSICAKNLGDEQLAVVICRLAEGRGGPLERHLISKSLLPFAIERGDSWLASLLEWELENYCQSFISMLGLQINSATETYATLSSGVAFSDPNVGLYCLLLATKNSMRNAVGERNTAILSRWAVFMTATALKRCGLPLEALEYLSSPTTILGDTDLGTVSDIGDFEKLNGILNPSPKNSSNWLSSNVAFRVEFLARLDLALQYLSTLVREHPSWADTVVAPSRAISHINECENHEHVKVLGSFRQKLYTALHHLEQKFSVVPFHLISMVLLSLYNRGLWFVGYEILHSYTSQDPDLNKSQIVISLLHPLMHKQLLKATRETSLLFSRVIAACSITCSKLKSDCLENNVSGESGSSSSNAWEYYFQGLILSLRSLRSALQIISVSSTEDLIMKPLIIIDWIEYYVQFACAWLQKNSKVLFLLMQPLLITFTNGHTPYEVDLMDLKKILPQIAESVTQYSLIDNVCIGLQGSQGTDVAHLIPEDERWQITGACLWQHISRLMKHKIGMLSYKLDEGCISGVPDGKHFSSVPCSENLGPDDNRTEEVIGLVSLSLVKLLKTTLAHVSSYHVMRLASHLQHKMDNGLHVMTLVWLEEYNQSQTRGLNQHLNQDMLKLETIGEKHGSDILWDICADPKIISESFTQEKINWSHSLDHKPSKGWNNIYRGVTTVDETEETHNHELTPKSTSANSEAGLPSRSLFRSGHSFLSGWQKDTTATKEVSPFLNPKEIYKRNGELLEALCLNSVNQKQAALASNRKGIIFFNWKDDMPDRDHSDYIWSEADWPLNGWAGSESTPAPTYVSPGVGLGIKQGTHVGLGGATVGVGSLARSARDLRGGGAFGNQGYPGMRVSGLGWETREDFEEVVDPPPTVENANTRVFSSHPSRPFFLVGSSNTHIYLWEFGKDKATATYGVLPAANVPPPYALASISALQFDHCGHRFATAALDGTVCTWQLEVGGRSNIRPTESSLCFNSHASDVAYVTSSGSIIAVAGYSSSSVNVVVWDTLAPPTTSRASIICHEGGARSLSVFDNDIGSGSISPLIVTGGKGGDVGLHDFRYIATGRSKRHRHTDKGEQAVKTSSNIDHHPADGNRFGEQNQNGMLWYIPKAHSGSVTKISTIPNTSLFLTGSKDGDVKLWDAKRAKLVYHWPKLHERHTFLQPSSRGFGGVVQAAVTDIKVVSQGFLTCGGDGTVKLVHLKDHQY